MRAGVRHCSLHNGEVGVADRLTRECEFCVQASCHRTPLLCSFLGSCLRKHQARVRRSFCVFSATHNRSSVSAPWCLRKKATASIRLRRIRLRTCPFDRASQSARPDMRSLTSARDRRRQSVCLRKIGLWVRMETECMVCRASADYRVIF